MSNNANGNIHLKINAGEKLSAIKEEFNQTFPYLRLEFFKHKHKLHGANSKSDILQSDLTLRQLHRMADHHSIEINENMKVAALEELFQKEFGISVQVFRKSGRSWLETTVTDDWTLKRQNDEGQDLSRFNKD